MCPNPKTEKLGKSAKTVCGKSQGKNIFYRLCLLLASLLYKQFHHTVFIIALQDVSKSVRKYKKKYENI